MCGTMLALTLMYQTTSVRCERDPRTAGRAKPARRDASSDCLRNPISEDEKRPQDKECSVYSLNLCA